MIGRTMYIRRSMPEINSGTVLVGDGEPSIRGTGRISAASRPRRVFQASVPHATEIRAGACHPFSIHEVE